VNEVGACVVLEVKGITALAEGHEVSCSVICITWSARGIQSAKSHDHRQHLSPHSSRAYKKTVGKIYHIGGQQALRVGAGRLRLLVCGTC
jgi:hypothetical protein